jgi:hypothetical protein
MEPGAFFGGFYLGGALIVAFAIIVRGIPLSALLISYSPVSFSPYRLFKLGNDFVGLRLADSVAESDGSLSVLERNWPGAECVQRGEAGAFGVVRFRINAKI